MKLAFNKNQTGPVTVSKKGRKKLKLKFERKTLGGDDKLFLCLVP